MKIKIKDEMDNIKVTLSHKELVLLKEAMICILDTKNRNNKNIDLDILNQELFDKDEYENSIDVEKDISDIYFTIKRTLKDINVW